MTDDTGPGRVRAGWQISPDLAQLAHDWPTVVGEVDPPPAGHVCSFEACRHDTRCGDELCSGLIWPADLQGRISHLMQAHGFRMDGRCFDNHNREITTAARELELIRADR